MSDTTRLDETAAVTAVRNAALDLRGMCSAQGRTEAENVILANIDAVLAEVERLRDENERLYDEAEVSDGVASFMATERDDALVESEGMRAERDAALAAVTAVRELCEREEADAMEPENAFIETSRVIAALGTVGQPQGDASV